MSAEESVVVSSYDPQLWNAVYDTQQDMFEVPLVFTAQMSGTVRLGPAGRAWLQHVTMHGPVADTVMALADDGTGPRHHLDDGTADPRLGGATPGPTVSPCS
ncbi:hypothetical protein [Streptomyces sp. NBC_00273]|uniref:hypothetical protein n=1 Tax=Streptomyces sp. NBC_00273 TaxID=2903644 RepID=UPI002E29CF12|nr:hypothetical protein [Streptomyces sp. NBC_00273]